MIPVTKFSAYLIIYLRQVGTTFYIPSLEFPTGLR